MTGENEYYIYEDNDPHITNPRSLGYMIWTRIPDNRLEINFETDEQIRSSGFTLEWRCAVEDAGNKCSDADFNANVIKAIFNAFETDQHRFTKAKGNKVKNERNAHKRLRKWSVRIKTIFVSHVRRVEAMDRPCLQNYHNPSKSLVGRKCNLNISDVASMCENLGEYLSNVWQNCKRDVKPARLRKKCAQIQTKIAEIERGRK